MQQWKFRDTVRYLLCDEDKDNPYVLTCQSTATSTTCATQMELLSVKMEDKHSPNELRRVIILGLDNWRYGKTVRFITSNRLLTNDVNTQS